MLAPKRLEILAHFMTHRGTSLTEAAVWMGSAESRMAAVALRDPEYAETIT